jgi:hypothetical protein
VAAFATDFGHVSAVTADRLSTLATNFGHVLAILADRSAAFAPDTRHVRPVATDGFAAFASDAGHVESVAAYGLPTFASRFAGLLRRKLVSTALDMGGFPSLASDLSLPLLRHRGETAPRTFRHVAS